VVIDRVSGFIIGLSAEGICFILVTKLMLELIVVLLELNLPTGCTRSNFL